MWFPQPQVRHLSFPLLARHLHCVRLAVVHWSQLGKVVTVPICSRGSSHPRQSSYICTTWEGGRVPDPRRLGAIWTLNKGISFQGKLWLSISKFLKRKPLITRSPFAESDLTLSKFFQHFSIQVYRKQVEFYCWKLQSSHSGKNN